MTSYAYVFLRTLFGSKGLEFDDVSSSLRCISLPADVHIASTKVILYNFFEESTRTNIWRHLADVMTEELRDVKHAPLIHEVGDKTFICIVAQTYSPEAQIYIRGYYSGQEKALDRRFI